MDSIIDRLNSSAPCGVIRDGAAMALVRVQDAHAAAARLRELEINLCETQRQLNIAREHNEELADENANLVGRIAAAKATLAA